MLNKLWIWKNLSEEEILARESLDIEGIRNMINHIII